MRAPGQTGRLGSGGPQKLECAGIDPARREHPAVDLKAGPEVGQYQLDLGGSGRDGGFGVEIVPLGHAPQTLMAGPGGADR